MFSLPPQVNTALELLTAAGFEAYVVGGAVRDLAAGLEGGEDWDIAAAALPEQTKAIFSDYRLLETGIKHGTVTVLLEGLPLEITTYRLDGAYTDGRRPDSVEFTASLEEDLKRRDFTVNALAYHPKTGVVDLVGGLADLRSGVLRCVGEPECRFREDALRILRGLRFAATRGMTIEPNTAAAMHACRELLGSIARERVQAELTKALQGENIVPILREFGDIFAAVIPELSPMFGFAQHNPHHDRDVWEHTLGVVENVPAAPVMRWAALLHDVGKPRCFSLDETGVGHFYDHAKVSAQMADTILRRLRFDHATREAVVQVIELHMRPAADDRRQLRRLLSKVGEEQLRRLLGLWRGDTLAQSSLCRDRLEVIRRAEIALEEILAEESCFSLKHLAVNGRDMMALGLEGKEVGLALHLCLDGVLEERCPNEHDSLLEFVRKKFQLV